MRRRLNLRAFLIVLLVFGLLGAGVYFFHNWQVNHQIKSYLLKAEQAIVDKDPQMAREYLERYLLLQPNEAQALNRYALLLDDSAKSPLEKTRAYLTLEKAIRQYIVQGETQTVPIELQKRAAIRALDLIPKRYRDAKAHLEPLLKSSPQDIDVKEMFAECIVNLGEVEKAEALYVELIKLSPNRLKSY